MHHDFLPQVLWNFIWAICPPLLLVLTGQGIPLTVCAGRDLCFCLQRNKVFRSFPFGMVRGALIPKGNGTGLWKCSLWHATSLEQAWNHHQGSLYQPFDGKCFICLFISVCLRLWHALSVNIDLESPAQNLSRSIPKGSSARASRILHLRKLNQSSPFEHLTLL